MHKLTRRYRRRPARGNFRHVVFERLEPRSLLAPLTNLGTPDDVVFNLPATANTVVLEDDGIAGNGISQLRSTNGTFDTTTVANPSGSLTIRSGNAADTIAIHSLPDFTAGFTIGSSSSPLGSIAFAGAVNLTTDKSLTAYASGTISLPNSASQITSAGNGAISLITLRNISLSGGSNITSVDGAIALSANQQATPTVGNFVGIDVGAASLQATGSGAVTVQG
jgi:hypothetical protein